MTLSRRRFISISAASFLSAGAAQAETRWQGRALGADASILLRTARDVADEVFSSVRAELRRIEALFSLYQPSSALVRLNSTGIASEPGSDFLALCQASSRMHALSKGRFDPTVQGLWQALAQGVPPGDAEAALGWHKVRYGPQGIRLGERQSLTFNGIAQGFATDKIAELLRGFGLDDVLINIGEYRALGGPYKVGIADPEDGHIATVGLTGKAIATSSPSALLVGGRHHILDPIGKYAPRWSTISVVASSATLADAASTAFSLMARDDIVGVLAKERSIREVHLHSAAGHYLRLQNQFS